jgi:hypothetical protein
MPDFKPKNFSPWLSQYTFTEPRVVFHDIDFNPLSQVTKSIQSLPTSHAHVHYMRDGELTVYRRSDSRVWQYKFKLETGRWYRASTRKTILEHAIRIASDLYDESRYRERLGLTPQQKTFKDFALAKFAYRSSIHRHETGNSRFCWSSAQADHIEALSEMTVLYTLGNKFDH